MGVGRRRLLAHQAATGSGSLPAHIWIALLCGIALAIGFDEQLRDAPVYGKPPVVETPLQALSTGARNQYVTVTGPMGSDVSIEDRNDKDEVYTPMYDAKTHQAFLVKTSGGVPSGTETYTGMLRQIPSDLRKHLREEGGLLGRYEVAELVLSQCRKHARQPADLRAPRSSWPVCLFY